jgi:tetratricopeptide (TPR) repeat protein
MDERVPRTNLNNVLAKLNGGIAEHDYEDCLALLEQHECWVPYFRLVQQHLSASANLPDFVRLARIKNLYLEDVASASDACSEAISKLDLTYLRFRHEILDQVLEQDDVAAEGVILQAAWNRFKKKPDRIIALERLCHLYEKRTHNENLLLKYYDKLREVEPTNVKALRFFRTLYSQNQEWSKASDVVFTLLKNAKHKQEVSRYAQELAAVHLYQLDEPQKALSLIEQYCVGGPLDTSTIHYEAYFRLGDLKGCMSVLQRCLDTVDEDSTRAIIKFRMAILREQQGDITKAYADYESALKLAPNFLEALEGLVGVAIIRKDWDSVKSWLGKLSKNVRETTLVSQIEQAIARLDEALAHESNSHESNKHGSTVKTEDKSL